MKKVILFIISAMIWTSCVENSAEYKKLKSENEMLKAEKAQSTTELNEMLSTLNDIQTDIQASRDAEKQRCCVSLPDLNSRIQGLSPLTGKILSA